MKLKHQRTALHAFTILEVMIALSIFFMCVFAILGVVSRCINQARNLEPFQIDPSSALAELSLTNRLEEGPLPGDIIDHFQQEHPGYTLDGSITEVATNGLFQIDFVVGGITTTRKVVRPEPASVLLFRPLSGQRGGFGGLRR
jgi:hypothetical protein